MRVWIFFQFVTLFIIFLPARQCLCCWFNLQHIDWLVLLNFNSSLYDVWSFQSNLIYFYAAICIFFTGKSYGHLSILLEASNILLLWAQHHFFNSLGVLHIFRPLSAASFIYCFLQFKYSVSLFPRLTIPFKCCVVKWNTLTGVNSIYDALEWKETLSVKFHSISNAMYTRFHHDQTHLLSLIMHQPLCHVISSIADMSPHLEGMELPLRMVFHCVFYEFSWT